MRAVLTRADLAERSARVLQHGRGASPDVYLVRSGHGRVVVKDFARRGRLVRALLGPWLNAREIRAYRALVGHPAVPRFLGRIDALAFAVEYRPGRRISARLARSLPDAFMDELAAAVGEMHARGVAHLDLRHRTNVLAGDDGHPVLIDFASAVCLPPDSLLGRLVLPWLARVDHGGLAKVRERRRRQAADEPEEDGGESASTRGASRPT